VFRAEDDGTEKAVLHAKERDLFRTKVGVRRAMEVYTLEMYKNPKAARESFLNKLFHEASDFFWIKMVLRVVMAFSLTTVECERDFSWLQHLLDEKRLSMGNGMKRGCRWGTA